jgi:hypothetical protein
MDVRATSRDQVRTSAQACTLKSLHAMRARVVGGCMDGLWWIDEKEWRAEAFDAVIGNDRWECLTAEVAPDGSQLLAVYRMRLTGARRRVALSRATTAGANERRAEIRRRLGILPLNHSDAVPPPSEAAARPTSQRARSQRLRARRASKSSNVLGA